MEKLDCCCSLIKELEAAVLEQQRRWNAGAKRVLFSVPHFLSLPVAFNKYGGGTVKINIMILLKFQFEIFF